MPTTLAQFTIDTTLSSTPASIITTSTNENKFIGMMVFTNSSTTTNREVTVWRLGSATSQTATNYLVKKSILPTKTWICDELLGQNISNGSKIQADQDVGTDVNVNASGVTET